MVKLTGNNLPKRQHQLNIKVNEAASKKVLFDEIKAETEVSDVDRLFKIDLAAKYKNVDYVVETLKSGDSLYIIRVLKKCLWLYDDEFSNIINTDYLHHNIFPFMSIKMKKKLLTAAAMYIKNENLAADFYQYCKKTELEDLADKFLLSTSELFKIELLRNSKVSEKDSNKYFEHFIGNSFTLFEAALDCDVWHKSNIFRECSYLYTISDVRYLDLLEKYASLKSGRQYNNFKFGLRISKDIVIKHKERMLKNQDLYMKILNLGKVLRHSSRNEVEFFTIFLLPSNISEFWTKSHQTEFKQIINVVPENERYAFAKKIFTDKYHNEEFEMSKEFYNQKYYNLMTTAEREVWALQHLHSGKEIFGSGKDFIWYKFLNFDKAFSEIKKCIHTTTDKGKRSDILEVLVQSAKSNKELERVLHYYYERHVNERKNNKIAFIHKVIDHHSVFKFDEKCWTAFNKLLLSIEMSDSGVEHRFKTVAILYHILNEKNMPESLILYMESSIAVYSLMLHVKCIDLESKRKVYDYLFKFYSDRINKFEPGCKDDKLVLCVHFLLDLMKEFDKTKADIPDSIMQFVNSDKDSYQYKKILQSSTNTGISENDLLKCLKTDTKLIIEKLPEVEKAIDASWNFRMNRLLSKLRIYFFNDVIVKEFVNFLNNLLTKENAYSKPASAAVYGIFQLCDEDYKINFMNKYVPQSAKIKYDEIDSTFLCTQQAICRFVCYSRPPLPLSNILMYLKGDYVRYCLPMFNRYLSNLPMNMCLKFIETLIDSPVSIQKQALRLAYQCFNAENLKKLFLDAWKSTKNVSIRSVIYKAVLKKTIENKVFSEALIALTSDLDDTDDDELFDIYKYSKLPLNSLGDFAEAFWKTISVFKDNEQNISRKRDILNFMQDKIEFMNKGIVKEIVCEHVNALFNKTDGDQKYESLNKAKWNLVTHYIEFFTSDESELSESMKMAKFIANECFKRWNEVACDLYVFRKLYREFIEKLNNIRFVQVPEVGNYLADTNSFENALPIFEAILLELQSTLPLHETYIDVWTLRIIITNRRVIKETRVKYKNDNGIKVMEETAEKFGREVGIMVKEAAENKLFFVYFLNDIKTLLCTGANRIVRHLEEKESGAQDNVELRIARGLLELNTKETNLLASQVIPLDKDCDLELYKSVYNTLITNADTEIQCCVYKKFSGDCKKRRFE